MSERGIYWLVMLILLLLLSHIFDLMLNVVTRCYTGKSGSFRSHKHCIDPCLLLLQSDEVCTCYYKLVLNIVVS